MRFWRPVLILILAAGVSWWMGQQLAARQPALQPSAVKTTTKSPVLANTSANTSANTPKVAVPLDITLQKHAVASGETLFSIGRQYNITWTAIADLNGITDKTPLKIGASLTIPITISGHVVHTAAIPVVEQDTKLAQQETVWGNLKWRLDPVAVVYQTAPAETPLIHSDPATLLGRDYTGGTATVEITHDRSIYRFQLTQPVTKGENGVWFLTGYTSYIPQD